VHKDDNLTTMLGLSRNVETLIPETLRAPRACNGTALSFLHNSLYIFEKWGEKINHKKMYYNYSKKMFTGRAKPIRIIGEPDNQRPDK